MEWFYNRRMFALTSLIPRIVCVKHASLFFSLSSYLSIHSLTLILIRFISLSLSLSYYPTLIIISLSLSFSFLTLIISPLSSFHVISPSSSTQSALLFVTNTNLQSIASSSKWLNSVTWCNIEHEKKKKVVKMYALIMNEFTELCIHLKQNSRG